MKVDQKVIRDHLVSKELRHRLHSESASPKPG